MNLRKITDANYMRMKNAGYAGRTIILGKTPDGESVIQLYWTVGRSKNSQNRYLLKCDTGLKTEPITQDKNMILPELLIYNITRELHSKHIISNGTQTDMIFDYISKNKSFEKAINDMEFEHDGPIYTPRISGMIQFEESDIKFKLGIVKTLNQNPEIALKQSFSYGEVEAGYGFGIQTYDFDNECYPYNGEPYLLEMLNDIDELVEKYRAVIPVEKRVGMYAKFINIKTGHIEERIINERV